MSKGHKDVGRNLKKSFLYKHHGWKIWKRKRIKVEFYSCHGSQNPNVVLFLLCPSLPLELPLSLPAHNSQNTHLDTTSWVWEGGKERGRKGGISGGWDERVSKTSNKLTGGGGGLYVRGSMHSLTASFRVFSHRVTCGKCLLGQFLPVNIIVWERAWNDGIKHEKINRSTTLEVI